MQTSLLHSRLRAACSFSLLSGSARLWLSLLAALLFIQPLRAQTIATVAGTGVQGYNGDNIQATTAQLSSPNAVVLDASGNMFIAEAGNNRIRRVDKATGVITTIAGNGVAGSSGDNGPATSAQLNAPVALAFNSNYSVLYIADFNNHKVRRIDINSGTIVTVVGTGTPGSTIGSGNPNGTSSQLNGPAGLTVDGSDLLYISDQQNHRILRYDSPSSFLSSFAGTGTAGYNGNNSPATSFQLNTPGGLAFNGTSVYVADRLNHRVRKIDIPTNSISNVAGSGTAGYSGDGGQAGSAQLNRPDGIAFDATGRLYIADRDNHRVRRMDLSNGAGLIFTVAGTGTAGFSGDGSPATSAQLNEPAAVAFDPSGSLFIADIANQRIRRLSNALTAVAQARPNPVCAGSSAALSVTATGGTAPYSYTWAAPAGVVLSGTSTSAITATPNAGVSGVQTLTITVADAASTPVRSTSLVSLTVNAPITVGIAATPSLTIGTGQSTTLTASVPGATGAVTYEWSANTGGVVSNSVVVNTAGTYSVTATSGGCSATASAVVSVTVLTFCNTVAYTTPAGAGLKNGTSWANAMTGIDLPPALASSCAGTTFLVGAGLYKPTTVTTDRGASFAIAPGVEVYGGYTVSGGSATRGPVNPVAGAPSSTTFSGDIDNNNVLNSSNTSSVVSFSNATGSTRLDGVVITEGYASVIDASGGGIRVVGTGSPTLTNCLITANYAGNQGGGYFHDAPTSPILTDCAFTSNTATLGGAVFVNTSIAMMVNGLRIRQNTAQANGGGILTNGPVVVQSSDISQNTAGSLGGAIYLNTGNTSLSITSSTLVQNQSNAPGGAISNLNSMTTTLTDVLMDDNVSSSNGGSLYVGSSNSPLTMTNVRMRRNRANAPGGAVYANGPVTITGSDISQNTCTNGPGGALHLNTSSSLSITSSTLSQNQSNGPGGAVNSTASMTATLTDVVMDDNVSNANGGAMYISSSNSPLTMTNVQMRRNRANSPGGAIQTNGDVRLTNCDISQNSASSIGGALCNSSGGALTAINTRLNGNRSNGPGGAVFMSGSVFLSGVQMSQNSATGSSSDGGALYTNSASSFSGVSSTLSQNQATGQAGAVYVSGSGNNPTILTDVVMSQNTAVNGQAGAFYQGNNSSTLLMTNVQMNENQSGTSGGALSPNGPVSMTNCTLNLNRALGGNGGGAVSASTSVSALNSQFNSNRASQNGGAITASDVFLTNCAISQNSATGGSSNYGGGLFMSSGNSNLLSCSLVQNTSGQQGGAIFTYAPMQVVNSMFSRNTALEIGGAIQTFSSLTLTNTSLSGNTAPTGAAVANSSSGIVLAQNSILWNNGTPVTSLTNTYTGSISLTYSLINPGATFTDGGNNKTSDPLFTSAATDDLTLSGCSPAIDAGNNAFNSTPTDGSGNSRIVNSTGTPAATIDMGAYEFSGTPRQANAITMQPPGGSAVCSGATVSIPVSVSGSGPISAQLYRNGAPVGSPQTNTTFTLANVQPADAGSYSVVISGGCNSLTTSAFTLTVGITPANPTLVASGPITCTQTAVRLTATTSSAGNFSYAFAGPNVTNASPTAGTALANAARPYSVTITDLASNCFNTATTSVQADTAPPAVSISPSTPALGCGISSVTLTANVSAGATYRWDNGSVNQPTRVISASGVYGLSATATNGCSATATSVTITQGNTVLPTVTLVFNNSATVMGSGTPTIRIPNTPGQQFRALGGVSYEYVSVIDRINGYEIRTNERNSTGVFEIRRLGPFSVTVNDGTGCSRTVQGILANP